MLTLRFGVTLSFRWVGVVGVHKNKYSKKKKNTRTKRLEIFFSPFVDFSRSIGITTSSLGICELHMTATSGVRLHDRSPPGHRSALFHLRDTRPTTHTLAPAV